MPQTKSYPTPESELLTAVQMLTDEVKVLRQVIDELREEVQWANHNHPGDNRMLGGRRIRSCLLDPTSPHFAVNTIDEKTAETLRAELPPIQTVPGKQGELFN